MLNSSLSASGKAYQGDHIIDPRNKKREYKHMRVWIHHEQASYSDALATAGMTMDINELRKLKNNCEGLIAIWILGLESQLEEIK
ncbi:MAG: FAD:protein FMN transferase [Planctomycetes bacterium]|nr:FAD:protein FMN transferase [Planctomycetota bacterium]